MSIDPKTLGIDAQRQILEKLGEQVHTGAARKYHNQPTARVADGGRVIRFDSQKEARRYDELVLLLKAGKIRNLKLQPEFTLVEAYTTAEGYHVRATKYRADFEYEKRTEYFSPLGIGSENLWIRVVEDVKSRATKTRVYEMKKKLLRERFGVEITEV